jgi:uncharacterized phage protein (TIGR01671 family)
MNKREIKFRVWDDETKIMIYPHNSTYRPHHQWFTKENTIEYANMQNGFTTTQIMQFTGLKDKNDREIYEGDIIKTSGLLDNIIGEVIFLTELGSWGIHPKDWDKLTTYRIYEGKREIIGNIYENPELV